MNAAQAKLAIGFLQSANDELTTERDRLRASNSEMLKALEMYVEYEKLYRGAMPVVMRPLTAKIIDTIAKVKS